MRKNFKQLTREQRIKIEAYHNLKMSVKEIAEHVGCHFTTIYRELKRGKTTKISGSDWKDKEIYSYDLGQIAHEVNKKKCGRKRILQDDIEYIEYVEMMILDYKYSTCRNTTKEIHKRQIGTLILMYVLLQYITILKQICFQT